MAAMTPPRIRSFRIEHIGLGLVVSWVYCCWFSPSLFSEIGYVTHNDLSWILSMSACVASIFLTSAVLKDRFLSHLKLAYPLAAFGTALSTVMMSTLVAGDAATLLVPLGSILSGIASGLLYVLWSEYVSTCDNDAVKGMAITVSLVAFACFLVVLLLPCPLSTVFVSTLPIVSSVPFLAVRQRIGYEQSVEVGGQAKRDRERDHALIRRIFAISVLVGAIAAFAWATASVESSAGLPGSVLLGAFGGIAVIFCVAASIYAFEINPNIARLYRVLIPTLIVSLVLLVSGYPACTVLAKTVLIALCMGFDFFLLMYFGSFLKERFSRPSRAFCFCEGFTNLGLATGNAAGVTIQNAIGATSAQLRDVYLLLVVVAVIALIVVVDQRNNVDSMSVSKVDESVYEVVSREYGLTAREKEILELFGQGRSVPFISDLLFVSKSTVETHRKHIYSKLEVHGRQELLDLLDAFKTR